MEVSHEWNVCGQILQTMKGCSQLQSFTSPLFSAFGCQWCLKLYPRKSIASAENKSVLHLFLRAYPPNIKSIHIASTLRCAQTGNHHDLFCKFEEKLSVNTNALKWSCALISFDEIQNLDLLTFIAKLTLVQIRDVSNNDVSKCTYVNTATTSTAKHEYQWEIDDQHLVQQMKKATFKQFFESPVFVAFGCEWRLIVYPSGHKEEGSVSSAIIIVSKCTNIKRVQIVQIIQCLQANSKTKRLATYDGLNPRYGPSKLSPSSDLQNCEALTFKVNMELTAVYDVDSKDVTSAHLNGELQRKQTVYELSKNNGDIVLMIDQELQEPPAKKRRVEDSGLDELPGAEEANSKMTEKVRVCSVLLRAVSKVFDNMFVNETLERKTGQIEISAKSVKEIDDLWYFICTGYLREDCNALELLSLAHMYDLQLMFKKCVARLMQSLSVDNCVQILLIFDKYEIERDLDEVLQFAEKNAGELQRRDEFSNLSFSLRRYILRPVKK